MGAGWLAEHEMLGRCAATKVLHSELASRPAVMTRFFNEARAATAIGDPGIVQTSHFGRHSDSDAHIVMELLDRAPLDRRLACHSALGLSDALRTMRQVASALDAAHVRGIVYRDLKPEDVFIARDPEIAGGERAKNLGSPAARLRHMAAFAEFSAIASARDRVSRAGASTSRVLDSASRGRRAVCK